MMSPCSRLLVVLCAGLCMGKRLPLCFLVLVVLFNVEEVVIGERVCNIERSVVLMRNSFVVCFFVLLVVEALCVAEGLYLP